MRHLVANKIKCLTCGDIIESLHRHDFKLCSCQKVGVDGGLEYSRLMGNPFDYWNLSTYSNEPFAIVRHHAYRTGYGKPNNPDYGTFRKTLLKDMTNDHLEASLVYPGVTKGGFHWQLLLEEKLFRLENEILISE